MSSDNDNTAFYLKPRFLFKLLTFVNLLNFIDRGIIPGATNEFNTFIQKDLDTDTPNVYLGLLQSSFVVGFVLGSLIFGHMIHHYGRFFLTGVGLTVWTVAVGLSGISFFTGSYTFLVFARMLSGFGEASLQCTIPPFIEATAPVGSRGTWLSIFFTAIPVGTAIGYAYSSIAAESIGWQYAFFIEAICMTPCIVFLFSIAKHFPCEHDEPLLADGAADTKNVRTVTQGASFEGGGRESGGGRTQPPTVLQEFLVVTSRPVYLCLTAGYAAQTGALIGLSTFGSSIMMGLGYFDTESESSTVFGLLVSIAGLFGTVMGGVLLDRMLVTNAEDTTVAGSVASVTAPQHDQPSEFVRRNSDDMMSTLLDPEHHPHHRGEGADEHSQEIANITKLITFSSFIGVICLVFNYFVYNKGLYLFLITAGCLFIFVCGSGINMGIMLSVPKQHRSFGIAVMATCIHAFGDVPSPIITGFLKDYLAPGCVSSAGDGDDQNISTSDACRDDNHGLRVTCLIVNIWLIWTFVFFGLAWYMNHTKRTTCSCFTRSLSFCGIHADPNGQQEYQSLSIQDDEYERSANNTNNARNTNKNNNQQRSSSGGNANQTGTAGGGRSSSSSSQGKGYEGPRMSESSVNRSSIGTNRSSNCSAAGGVVPSRPPTTNPIVGENYNSYIATKRMEQPINQRSRSKDSARSLSNDTNESATARSLRLSKSLKKNCSTEDLLSSFNIASTSFESGDFDSRQQGRGGGGSFRKSGSHRTKSSDKENRIPIGDTVMV